MSTSSGCILVSATKGFLPRVYIVSMTCSPLPSITRLSGNWLTTMFVRRSHLQEC